MLIFGYLMGSVITGCCMIIFYELREAKAIKKAYASGRESVIRVWAAQNIAQRAMRETSALTNLN